MLDYRFIKENIDAVKQNIKNRNMTSDADLVVELFNKRTQLISALQEFQQKRNENATAMKQKLDEAQRKALIEEGKALKEKISLMEAELKEAEEALDREGKKIPNMAHPDAPIGSLDTENLEVKQVGKPREFSFVPKDHVELGQNLDLIDFEAATKVSGPKFYYLKNEAVFLEQALTMYGLQILKKHGFTPFITPDIAREEILTGIGFNPRGNESNVYSLEGEDACLVATAEITLGGYHKDEILAKERLPLRYCGLSHCFRREAGAAGQFSKGLYRVHQFTKLEMFVYCTPEDSDAIHEELRLIEEEIFTGLGIPFRVVDTCTGDLGAPAYRKWDLEAWMPGRNGGEWGEVTSTSNCTDFQARRLNVRYKNEDGKNTFVHMLNGTAIAMSRALVAIFENYQNEDGSIDIPEVLQGLCGFSKIEAK
ncbi:MAG TPA: serine--tRNA ligase [Treponemataceae bacterium]|nr:serine--tRNA ligase [Treponema sp.]HOQ92416.1 serine--tRNA ligase [Treponemataceae bacterium]HPM05753.1 serine--tRNA ligase [Treponemataceae bacterium]HPY52754.1 serine--tRNA ligase [Treponemataceae bacterium]HQC26334.1 serine--tRNA ligase [Treponemataceae bacterium]